MQAERFDKCALAGTRYAGNADANGLAGVRNELPQYLLAHVEVSLRVAFHQRDGLSQDIAVASQYTGHILINR